MNHTLGPYTVRMDTVCAVHRHRELVPVNVHHIRPLGRGGADTPANEVTVCANGHYSIHALLDIMFRTGGEVPWALRRRYGWRVRRLAERGYRESTGRAT